jgi:dihydrofolate synthase / folylpolyglutamate synthase
MKRDLSQPLERLYERRTFGIKPGLEVEKALLKCAGNPERAFRVVHVAGTNGKGSVCAILDSVFRAAGWRTGLYTSPHLIRFNERMRVDGEPIPDGELAELLVDLDAWSREAVAETGHEATFFECGTAVAFEHFRRRNVEVAIVETGMGGRLDATNVVAPVVSVITGISVEHTAHLGPDVERIAFEKAGIVKTGRPVVCGAMSEAALDVVRLAAKERRSPLIVAPEHAGVRMISMNLSGQKVSVDTAETSYGTLKFPLIGRHQWDNLATAVTAVEIYGQYGGDAAEEKAVKAGVSNVCWPGRFQVLGTDPPVILDGAHNPGAAEALAASLAATLGGKPLGLVLGMCGDKDLRGFLKAFSGLARRLWAVPLRTDRGRPPAEIAAAARSLGWTVSEAALPAAMAEAEAWARASGGAVCETGSLFLVGEVLELREGRPDRGADPND